MMKKPRIPPMALVIFAVCMVSYSGPMVKGALNAGATPASVAFLRMLTAGLLIAPLDFTNAKRKGIPFRFSKRELLLTALAAVFLALHYLTWITSLTGTSTFASVALVCTQPLFVSLFSFLLFKEKTPRAALPSSAAICWRWRARCSWPVTGSPTVKSAAPYRRISTRRYCTLQPPPFSRCRCPRRAAL